MTENEHNALHRDHLERIRLLEANMVALAQNTERITNGHLKMIRDQQAAIQQLAGMVNQASAQVRGLGRFAETFTPRVNTVPGAGRPVQLPFIPRVSDSNMDVEEEDAEMVEDNS